jgi:hypothetical protein
MATGKPVRVALMADSGGADGAGTGAASECGMEARGRRVWKLLVMVQPVVAGEDPTRLDACPLGILCRLHVLRSCCRVHYLDRR